MSDAQRIFNVARDFTLSGRTFSVPKHTLRQEAELEAWVQSRIPDPYQEIAKRCRTLADGDQELYRQLINDAKPEIATIPARLFPKSVKFGSEAFNTILSSRDGIRQLISMALRTRNPSLSEEQIDGFIEDPGNEDSLSEVQSWFFSGMTVAELQLRMEEEKKRRAGPQANRDGDNLQLRLEPEAQAAE